MVHGAIKSSLRLSELSTLCLLRQTYTHKQRLLQKNPPVLLCTHPALYLGGVCSLGWGTRVIFKIGHLVSMSSQLGHGCILRKSKYSAVSH